MKRNNRTFFTILLSIFVLFGLIYFVATALYPRETVKIISPNNHDRIVNGNYVGAGFVGTPFVIYYNGTEAQKTAKISRVGYYTEFCTLQVRQKTTCGPFATPSLGENLFRVEIDSSNSSPVYDEVTVDWVPLALLEYPIYYLGLKNITTGYLVLSLVVIIILAFKVMNKTKSLGLTLVSIWSGVSVVSLYLYSSRFQNPTLFFYFLIVVWTSVMVFIYWKFFYKKPIIQLPINSSVSVVDGVVTERKVTGIIPSPKNELKK